MKKTKMFNKYLIDLFVRIIIFLMIFIIYLMNKSLLDTLINQSILKGITPIHILWLFFMATMITHIFPRKKSSMTMNKAIYNCYGEKYDELKLLKFVQEQNIRAWVVMLCWLSFNAIFGILYVFEIIDAIDLFVLTIFYFLCDYICILIYCPFQKHIMKNRCCINCRIYDWGHFMMFTPMLFIKSFFSWSLFFTSLIVLIRWEIIYAKHPERFWYGSNTNLQCQNCKEKLCKIKKTLNTNAKN